MSDGLNKVMLIGNLGKDPEMRYTANGTARTTFSLAVGRSFMADEGRREETEWFNVVTWTKLAEIVATNLTKGRKVYVEGRLTTRSYEGNDGQRRYVTEVVANSVLFLEPRPQGGPYGGIDSIPDDIDPDDLPLD